MSLDLPLTLRKPWLFDSIASIASRSVRMIVKSGSPPPVQSKSFHLSFLDQNVVRVYTQTLSIFPVSVMAVLERNLAFLTTRFSSLIRMKRKQPSQP